MDQIADELIRRQERLASDRGPLESHWQEIAELVKPSRADFIQKQSIQGKREQKIFDGTAGMAADNLAAGLWGMITNSSLDWFSLQSSVDEVETDRGTRLWLDECTRRMQHAFSANGQKFYSRVMELYSDLVIFGTGVFYTEEMPESGSIFYSCRHLAECYVAENDRQIVDTIFRRFSFTARQAYMRWGDRCGPAVLRAVEKEPERPFLFLHVVMPSDDLAEENTEIRPPFVSHYIAMEDRKVISRGYYHEFPYQVPRWSTSSRHIYGDSPAMTALADIKMLNAMSKTVIIAAQKAVDPPLLASDESAVRGLRTHPGGVIYGGLDENGRRRYEPLSAGGQIELGLELEEQRRQAVREAFLHSLLQMVAQPNQTATEIIARQEEKLRLVGPHLGRIQSEFLDPLVRRQFNVMWRAGALPPPPDTIRNSPIRVSYVSPLARAQRANEGTAIIRAFEALTPLTALNPSILDNIDADQTARAVAEAFGVPGKLFVDPKTVEKKRAQNQAQAVPPTGMPPA